MADNTSPNGQANEYNGRHRMGDPTNSESVPSTTIRERIAREKSSSNGRDDDFKQAA